MEFDICTMVSLVVSAVAGGSACYVILAQGKRLKAADRSLAAASNRYDTCKGLLLRANKELTHEAEERARLDSMLGTWMKACDAKDARIEVLERQIEDTRTANHAAMMRDSAVNSIKEELRHCNARRQRLEGDVEKLRSALKAIGEMAEESSNL